jgi:hypothetical protein
MQTGKSKLFVCETKFPERRPMGADGKTDAKSPDQRHDEFAKKNEAWDRRVKSAVSELDKVADKAKRAVGSLRRRTPA